MKNTWICFALVLLLAGCVGFPAPTVIPADTETPLPTLAPARTLTPTERTALPVTTPTLESPGATPTSATLADGELTCRVLSQAVRNGRKLDPKETFDMGWMVRNTGTAAWDPGTVDFRYFSGRRMHVSERTHLRTSVVPGDTVLLLADMVTPKSSGPYTTVWSLRRGEDDFCHVSLSITVR